MSDTTVLVTGATGFVGRNFVGALAKRDVTIRAVVRQGTAERLPSLPRLEIIETPDVFAQDADWWAEACAGAERIAHLAWIATPGIYLTAPENLDCLTGTLALAKGAVKAEVRKVLGVGTCFEYDVDARIMAANTPLRPITPYAGAKAATFHSLSQWLPTFGVSFAWGRIFNLYGKGEHPDRLAPYLQETLASGKRADLTSGKQIRDFLDVEQGVELLMDALFGDMAGAFNVCSGRPQTVRQFAESIADQYGRRDLLNFGVRPDNLVDPLCVVGLPGQQGTGGDQ